MLADGYDIAISQHSSVDAAGVYKCAVRTVQICQNTSILVLDQLRMMSADEFALNLNVTVRTATDGDCFIVEQTGVGCTVIQSNQHPAIFWRAAWHRPSLTHSVG